MLPMSLKGCRGQLLWQISREGYWRLSPSTLCAKIPPGGSYVGDSKENVARREQRFCSHDFLMLRYGGRSRSKDRVRGRERDRERWWRSVFAAGAFVTPMWGTRRLWGNLYNTVFELCSMERSCKCFKQYRAKDGRLVWDFTVDGSCSSGFLFAFFVVPCLGFSRAVATFKVFELMWHLLINFSVRHTFGSGL